MSSDRDALVHALGQAIVADPAVADGAFDGYALLVTYEGGSRRIAGFRYRDGETPEAATPRSAAVETALDALREGARVEGEAPWEACVVRVARPSNRITIEFAYGDDAARWVVTPATLSTVAERARPTRPTRAA